ncbi:MAG: glutamine--tRNA ligase/YqeY domain fusion protein [Kiritimatiellia bacterium]
MTDFIREIVERDVQSGKNGGRVVTRFPPEPNGYLHIGHAGHVCLNFGIASEYGGTCHLRFDDTNPVTEQPEYVESIKEDIRWLGFDWGKHLYFASDYFDRMYGYALQLIDKGKAYVCELSSEEFKKYRGKPTAEGTPSPWRERPAPESRDLFERMRSGEFEDGKYVLRAKIDMSSPNLHMRDPAVYRILHASHHRTGDRWCVYPTYDFAHCLEDSMEGITHSLCTQEFEVHRPLYDWILDELGLFHPQQIEYARFNVTFTVLSKRKLLDLVRENLVDGWEDPRMPTIAGLRRRGCTPGAVREFFARSGLTKVEGYRDIALFEHCLRDELNATAPRVMAVLDPLKLVIDNYPEDLTEEIECVNNPEDPSAGTRRVPFSKELYVEKEDFHPDPPRKFHRLAPGREVRLRYAYFVTCTGYDTDKDGNVSTVHCTYDPETRGGDSPDGRKVKGTIHWVPAEKAIAAKVRLYDRLFTVERPEEAGPGDYTSRLNPDSLTGVTAMLEPSLRSAEKGCTYQFERKGYFHVDPVDSSEGKPVFNRVVPLRDSWAKRNRKAHAPRP